MLGHRQLSAAEFPGVWKRRWKWVLASALFGAAAGYGLARVVPARYTSSAVLEEDSRVVGRVPGVDPANMRLTSLREQALTPERMKALSSRSGISVAQLSQDVAIAATATGFSISVTTGNPRTSQQVCADLIPWLQQEDQKILQHQLNQTSSSGAVPTSAPQRVFSESQLAAARADKDEAASRLSDYRRQHAAELAGAGQRSAERKLADQQTQLEAVSADLNAALQQRSTLTEALLAQRNAPGQGKKTAELPSTQALEEELAAEQAKLVPLEARYTPDYPDVVKLKEDIQQLQKKIADARKAEGDAGGKKSVPAGAVGSTQSAQLQQQINDLDAKIQQKTREQVQLQQAIVAARTQADTSAIAQQELQELTARAESSRQLYASMLLQQDQTRGVDPSWPPQAGSARLMAAASLPERPSYPDPALFTLWGAGAGLAIGLLGIVAGEMSDKSLRTESDVENLLNLPTLAVIPAGGDFGMATGASGPRGGHTSNRGGKEDGVLADV